MIRYRLKKGQKKMAATRTAMFTAAVVVATLLIVSYMAMLQSTQRVLNIENNRILNVMVSRKMPGISDNDTAHFVQRLENQTDFRLAEYKSNQSSPMNAVAEPPKSEPPKSEPPKSEPPKSEPPKLEPPKSEPPKSEPPKSEPPKSEPPTPIGTHCSDRLCSQYLSTSDRMQFRQCMNKSLVLVKRFNETVQEGNCHFMDGRNRHPVALISFPGSGNTWVRGLLEAATGICTGAVYCDGSMRAKGFAGEYVQSGAVSVVKTHRNTPLWADSHINASDSRVHFGSWIFVARNPLNAIVAEWNRQVGNNFNGLTVILDSHVKKAGEKWFGNNSRWRSFVFNETQKWQTMVRNWIVNSTHHPVLVVRFEDLQDNALFQVKRMLDFLHLPYDATEVEHKLSADFISFQRSHTETKFKHFDPDQEQYVKSAISSTIHLLKQHGLSHLLPMQDYLA